MIALLAVCGLTTLAPGFMALTEAPTLPQTFDRTLITSQQNNWKFGFLYLTQERTMTVSAEHFDPDGGLVIWQPHPDRITRTHTSTNAEKTDLIDGTFTYFFDPTKDIEIFDRRPNTPIWYGSAIVLTAIGMVVFYLVVKNKRKSNPADESTQGQYPYHGSSH